MIISKIDWFCKHIFFKKHWKVTGALVVSYKVTNDEPLNHSIDFNVISVLAMTHHVTVTSDVDLFEN